MLRKRALKSFAEAFTRADQSAFVMSAALG